MEETLKAIEEWLRLGQIAKARQTLKKFNLAQLDRAQSIYFANVARRAGLFNMSIHALKKYVRPIGRQTFQATDSERAEYAASLIRVGAIEESLELLKEVDANKIPQASFYRSLGHFRLWQYSEAIPLLKDYILKMEVGSYPLLIGKINLAAAYVFCGQFLESDEILEELLEITRKNNFTVLLGNVLELLAQSAMGQENFPKAEKFLDQTSQFMIQQNTTNALYLKKWKTILEAQKFPHALHGEKFTELRQHAIEIKDWETARECDLREGTLTKNIKQLQKVYYGTPYQGYRDLVLEKNPWLKDELKTHFVWATEKTAPREIFELETGAWIDNKSSLKPGFGMHRLLIHLCRDFYRPSQMGSLFRSISPGDFYDPDSAHNRLHNLIHRLRAWTEDNNLAISVIERQSHYSLNLGATVGVRVPLKLDLGQFQNIESNQLVLLKSRFLQKTFTTKEIATALDLSPSKSNRVIKHGLQEGIIEKTRIGNFVHYKFKKVA